MQSHALRICYELRNREVYSKFVEQLNKEQLVVLLDKEINNLSMQNQLHTVYPCRVIQKL